MQQRLARLTSFSMLMAVLFSPPGAYAWGDEGHEAIAVIAWSRLSGPVQAKIKAILGADHDTLTKADFVSRATWADKWRDASPANHAATGQWHFVDIELSQPDVDAACFHHPQSQPGHASSGPANDCVLDKVDEFDSELKNPATSPQERLLALKFLEHFVGDMHQPLHDSDNHDRGGNQVAVAWSGKDTNLHSFWDNNLVQMLGSTPQDVAKTVLATYSSQQLAAWQAGTLTAWAQDGFNEAKTVAYDLKDQKSHSDPKLGVVVDIDQNYVHRAHPVVTEQLAKAGVRLAAVLQSALQ